MVVGTRRRRMTEESFDLILLNILNNKTTRCHIDKVLIEHGITTGLEIASISFQLALSMGANHVDDEGNVIEYNNKLTMFEALLISLFTSLVHQFDHKDGMDIADDDFLPMTRNDFNLHQIQALRHGTSLFGSDTPSTPGMMSPMARGNGKNHFQSPICMATTQSGDTIELNNFMKGINRDRTQYESLTNKANFESWKHSLLACTHRISDILDPNYLPNDIDEEKLFVEK
jgi:hypothetical protein